MKAPQASSPVGELPSCTEKKYPHSITDLKPWAGEECLSPQEVGEEALKTQKPNLMARSKGQQLGCQLLYPNQAQTSPLSGILS